MSVTQVIASSMTFTITTDAGATIEAACQLVGITSWADNTQAGTFVPVACGPDEGYTEPGDPAAGVATITFDLVHDWSEDGWSWLLSQIPGEVVDVTIVFDADQPDQATQYVGTVRVPVLTRTWSPRKTQRDAIAFLFPSLTGPTRPAPAAAAAEPAEQLLDA